MWWGDSAALVHVVRGWTPEEVEAFLRARCPTPIPQQVFVTTTPAWAPHPRFGYLGDEDAAESSTYAGLRALEKVYGNGVRQFTTVLSGHRGVDWTQGSRLSVAAAHGVSLAMPA